MNFDNNITDQVFTEVEAGINATVNKITTKCFDSTTNSFSMDCEGNLTVNSITTRVPIQGDSFTPNLTIDQIYPIGSIYLSLAVTNPGTLFGGTWEMISQGRTLVGVNPGDATFNASTMTGGEYYHMLTINEMPAHNHAEGDYQIGKKIGLWNLATTGNRLSVILDGQAGYGYPITEPTTQGANWAHYNMQPYFTCYIWARIA